MGRYFDYSDWEIEEIANDVRERIVETKKPLPKKINKHFIHIVYKTGDGVYSWSSNNYWLNNHVDFTNTNDAIDFLNKITWFEKIGDNMWVEVNNTKTYTDKNGKTIPYHYEIKEYDSEVYEDGEYHTEYTDEEIKYLSETLYMIEKARVYIREYDRANNNCSFGGGSYSEELKKSLEIFEREYTEELPDDYYEEE